MPMGPSAVVRCKFCGNTSLLPGIQPTQASATPASTLEEIRQLAMSGNLAGAIERYRQAYGVDPQEARNALAAIQAGTNGHAFRTGHARPWNAQALQQVQRLLADGDKIGAIKVYREHYDVSLERAKYAIEQIQAGQTLKPEMGFQALTSSPQTSPASTETTQTSRRSGCAAGSSLPLY